MASWYRIQNAAKNAPARIYIDDEIGIYGVSAKQFNADFNAIEGDEIHLHINSIGGDVFEGMAIYTTIANSPAKVVSHIESIAASTASWLALAADSVGIAKHAFMMIHNPYSLAIGDASELRAAAERLDAIRDSIVGFYTDKSGKPAEDVITMMEAETWMNADSAIQNGFADSLEEGPAETRNSLSRAIMNAVKKGAPTKRQLEAILRQHANMSRDEAVAFVSKGFGPGATGEPESGLERDFSEVVKQIQNVDAL